jgi:tetratricopeptide (TPR) repeat protein
MANMASTYRKQGRWMEAEKLYVQVMETRNMIDMDNLASTYRNQGRWTEAEKLSVQVMETMKTILGPEHPATLTCMWNFSHSLKELGRHAEALSMLQACVQLRHKRLGPAYRDTAAATANLKEWQELFPYSNLRPSSNAYPPAEQSQLSRSTQVQKEVRVIIYEDLIYSLLIHFIYSIFCIFCHLVETQTKHASNP